MSVEQVKAALNIMRRMPPSSTETSLSGLINLAPELTDELLQRVDQPLQVQDDPDSGRKYVLCDYNRDGDSYRSPWNNKYYPPIEDGFMPSEKLRKLEIEANYVFDAYRKLYFEGGYSSAYFWDLEGNNFAACFLIQKDVDQVRGLNEGSWNSIHVVEAIEQKKDHFEYKLTSTVIVCLELYVFVVNELQISMEVANDEVGKVNLSGNMTKQGSLTKNVGVANTHIMNIGRLIEDMELKIRNDIEGIYIQKTRTVLNGMRTNDGGPKQTMDFTNSLLSAVSKHGAKRDATSDSK